MATPQQQLPNLQGLPPPPLAPIGQLMSMLVELPRKMLGDTSQGLMSQSQDIPELLRQNIEYFNQQLQEIPKRLQALPKELEELNKQAMKDGFPLKTLGQGFLPFTQEATKQSSTSTDKKDDTPKLIGTTF